MPIEFNCHVCGKLLRTGDEKAGRTATCPGCGEKLTVPGEQAGAADEYDDHSDGGGDEFDDYDDGGEDFASSSAGPAPTAAGVTGARQIPPVRFAEHAGADLDDYRNFRAGDHGPGILLRLLVYH